MGSRLHPLLLVLLVGTLVSAIDYCPCGIDSNGDPVGWKYGSLWDDVMIILDTSEAMGAKGLDTASILIESLFTPTSDGLDSLSTDRKSPFYTNIAVVAASDTAEVLYKFNMTANDKVQGKVAINNGIAQMDFQNAFQAAMGLRSGRSDARAIIYIMSNSAPNLSLQAVNQFKSGGGLIIVNSFMENGEDAPAALKSLTSGGFYFSNSSYQQSLQAFCKANCFCKPDKHAYQGADPDVAASGGCYNAVASSLPFSKAKSNCASYGGIIACIHDAAKGQFVAKLLSQTTKSTYFWMGYERTDGDWKWEDESTDQYANWAVGEPSTASVANCAYVDSSTGNYPWGAGNCQMGLPFVCECTPCSAGNKC